MKNYSKVNKKKIIQITLTDIHLKKISSWIVIQEKLVQMNKKF